MIELSFYNGESNESGQDKESGHALHPSILKKRHEGLSTFGVVSIQRTIAQTDILEDRECFSSIHHITGALDGYENYPKKSDFNLSDTLRTVTKLGGKS